MDEKPFDLGLFIFLLALFDSAAVVLLFLLLVLIAKVKR